MFYLYKLAFLFVISKGQNLDGDIDTNGPEPLIPHTSIDEPALVPLGSVGDCIGREIPNKMSVFYGNTCKNFPKSIRVKAPVLKFRNTLVVIIKEDDFQMLDNITYMEIESNLLLIKFEPGCFLNMQKLTNLSISFNEKLTYFDEDLFEGLDNLKEIFLRNNGIKNIIDVTKALSPNYVPKLLTLVLNRNVLKEMTKNDFFPMEGTLLETLNLVLCQIEYIHPEVLKPLKNLKALRLGENLFGVKVITDLLQTTLNYSIPLQIINLYEVGFRGDPPKKLLETIAKSNITYLNLGRNHFEYLRDDSFPLMPNLETLVLRDVVAVDIGTKTFIGMTKLKYLVLNGNRLNYIHSGLLLKTLIYLDVSSNSYNLDTHFDVPDNIFNNMFSLQKLDLSYNQIDTITAFTFTGLVNLTILELNNAHISNIESGSFQPLKNLKRLNLENNFIGSDMALTANIFQGLDYLQVLLLGGCHIFNMSSEDSVFVHLPNLIYLGLQGNGLHIISSNQFLPMVNLTNLDLAGNNLQSWENEIFYGLKIKCLNLEKNKLLVITTKMLEDFSYLENLLLEGNPFSCDCNWYPTLVSLKNNSSLVKPSIITDYTSAVCVSPEKWHRYTISDYLYYLDSTGECEYIEHSNKVFLITFSTIFLILLACSLIICYYYRWNLRYWLFLAQKEIARRRKKAKLIKIPSIRDYNYTYDAFVSFSNEDKQFVEELVSYLENSEPNLKLCVYDRDFQIGTVISESVMQNIAMSRRIILIISDSFAKSQWCRWEMHLAECHQLSDESDDGLLLILLETVSNKFMTPFLKYLMKTRIYMEWDSDERKTTEFWEKLKSTLSAPKRIL